MQFEFPILFIICVFILGYFLLTHPDDFFGDDDK